MIKQELLDILVCPETHQPFKVADAALVAELNTRIKNGTLRNQQNEKVQEKIDGALIRSDNTRCYPVRQDIPILLVEEGISL